MADDASTPVSADDSNPGVPGLEKLLAEVNGLSIRLNQLGRAQAVSGGLPRGAYHVLRALERNGPQSVPQISRWRATSRQNIQILVNRLKAKGWVELSINPAHRRSSLVRLTARGRALLAQGTSQNAETLEGLSRELSASDVMGAARLLEDIRRLLAPELEIIPRSKPFRKATQRTSLETEDRKNSRSAGEEMRKPDVRAPRDEDEDFPLSLL